MEQAVIWICSAIEELAKTAYQANGVYQRASYSPEDNAGLALLKEWMANRSMSTYFDMVGNLFGRIEGKETSTVLIGSHRDTVKNGGKYDGALGLISSIAAAGSLYSEFGKPVKTVEVVATCEEEGSRFLSGYIGSRAIIGELHDQCLDEKDSSGKSLKTVLKEYGYYEGNILTQKENIERFVELHIEQGPILEEKGEKIGLVASIVGLLCGSVTFYGMQNHAGTTPMNLRQDPVPYMCQFITKMHDWVKPFSHNMVFTVGNINITPGAANVIAESAEITFDIRSNICELINDAEKMLAMIAQSIIEDSNGKINIDIHKARKDMPVEMDKEGIAMLEAIAEKRDTNCIILNSGAGHDSQIIGKKVKANMIFVPSVNGISHSADEYTRDTDIELGYSILKDFLKELAW